MIRSAARRRMRMLAVAGLALAAALPAAAACDPCAAAWTRPGCNEAARSMYSWPAASLTIEPSPSRRVAGYVLEWSLPDHDNAWRRITLPCDATGCPGVSSPLSLARLLTTRLNWLAIDPYSGVLVRLRVRAYGPAGESEPASQEVLVCMPRPTCP